MARPWYPRYPDDYARKTADLTFAEHGAYGLLMDQYYRTGEPLPACAETLFRICRGRGASERKALGVVLGRFFERRGVVLHNTRADEEIEHANDISLKRSAARNCRTSAPTIVEQKSTQLQLQPQESEIAKAISPKKRAIAWTDETHVEGEWRSAAHDARAARGLPGIDYELEADKFSHWAINAKPKKDWRRAFINWCLNARGGNGSGFNGGARNSPTADTVEQIFREIAATRDVRGGSREASHAETFGELAERQGLDQ